jgi:hypothetical protein
MALNPAKGGKTGALQLYRALTLSATGRKTLARHARQCIYVTQEKEEKGSQP